MRNEVGIGIEGRGWILTPLLDVYVTVHQRLERACGAPWRITKDTKSSVNETQLHISPADNLERRLLL